MKPFMISLLITVLSVSTFAASYTITGGYFSSKTFENSDTLLMTGGGGGTILGKGSSILDIRNTSSPYVYGVSGIDAITMNDNSQLYFSGGSLRHLGTTGNATIVLTGGQIDDINVYYYPGPGDLDHITIYCQPDWTYQDQYLSGRHGLTIVCLILDCTPKVPQVLRQYNLYSRTRLGVLARFRWLAASTQELKSLLLFGLPPCPKLCLPVSDP